MISIIVHASSFDKTLILQSLWQNMQFFTFSFSVLDEEQQSSLH